MEEKALQCVLLELLRSELQETEPSSAVKAQLVPDAFPALFELSKRHDVAHIVSTALYKSGLLTDEGLLAKFNKAEIISVYRHEQMKFAYGQICKAFDEAEIQYIPLKGSVIRDFYPSESMRTSCDIDILVKENDLDAAVAALKEKGYNCGEKNYHDISLFSENNIHLELHFSILENIDSLDVVLKDAWKYAEVSDGCRYAFSDDFFLFHMFAHMSYHFLSGGCGIRSLMDVWIMEHKMGISYENARELLERAGIYKFAKEISELAAVCFSDKSGDDFSGILLSYIFDGGVYGSAQNKMVVEKTSDRRTSSYIMKRLFLPYRDMTISFPILKKLPMLLPFCWLIRAFKMLFSGNVKKSVSEIKLANSVSDGEIKTVELLKKQLGL